MRMRPCESRYSRHAADLAEKAANKAEGLALDDADAATAATQKLSASPFAHHEPHHMHIQYCAS